MHKITLFLRMLTAALMGVAAGIEVALKVRALHASSSPGNQSGGADMPSLQERVLAAVARPGTPWEDHPEGYESGGDR